MKSFYVSVCISISSKLEIRYSINRFALFVHQTHILPEAHTHVHTRTYINTYLSKTLLLITLISSETLLTREKKNLACRKMEMRERERERERESTCHFYLFLPLTSPPFLHERLFEWPLKMMCFFS